MGFVWSLALPPGQLNVVLAASYLVDAPRLVRFFFSNDTAPTEIYTLSLHDALPISTCSSIFMRAPRGGGAPPGRRRLRRDRKSTRLNSSHTVISYAVFCLKKKKRAALGSHEQPAPSLAAFPASRVPPQTEYSGGTCQ